jgi:hypothetical protein
VGKSSQQNFVIYFKLPKVNSHTIGENSPNLITVHTYIQALGCNGHRNSQRIRRSWVRVLTWYMYVGFKALNEKITIVLLGYILGDSVATSSGHPVLNDSRAGPAYIYSWVLSLHFLINKQMRGHWILEHSSMKTLFLKNDFLTKTKNHAKVIKMFWMSSWGAGAGAIAKYEQGFISYNFTH